MSYKCCYGWKGSQWALLHQSYTSRPVVVRKSQTTQIEASIVQAVCVELQRLKVHCTDLSGQGTIKLCTATHSSSRQAHSRMIHSSAFTWCVG